MLSFAILDPAAWRAFHGARRGAAEAASTPVDGDCYLMTSLHVLGEGEDPTESV
jgi:5,10-methylenetetrahydromethanopterin reductase